MGDTLQGLVDTLYKTCPDMEISRVQTESIVIALVAVQAIQIGNTSATDSWVYTTNSLANNKSVLSSYTLLNWAPSLANPQLEDDKIGQWLIAKLVILGWAVRMSAGSLHYTTSFCYFNKP